MSIFVDPDAMIPIEVRFTYVQNSAGQIIGVKILNDEDGPQADEKKIVCEARGRDYDSMSMILEEVTVINHISAQPMIRSKLFRVMIIEKFFIKWNVKDSTGAMVPINAENINKMFYSLVKHLTSKWLAATSS